MVIICKKEKSPISLNNDCKENSLVTNNRFILLDAYLLFFTALTIMAWNAFHRERSRYTPRK